MSDRQYVRSSSGMWHGFVTWTRVPGATRTVCGRTLRNRETADIADRIPSAGQFCENCGRSIAARTDVEAE